MGNISFGGLASGLDSQSIIQQLMTLESRPLNLLNTQRSRLEQQNEAYRTLNTRISALENAAFELTQLGNVRGRKASSSNNDKLLATANANAQTGTFSVEILQRASASVLRTGSDAGQGNGFGGVADASDFSGLTLSEINAANRLSSSLSAGTFSVNGQSVSILSSDTLADVFGKISTATGGAVTGQLLADNSKGGLVVELSSTDPIAVSKGSSNFLSAFKLDTASYDSVNDRLQSSDAVNSVRSDLLLDNSAGQTNLAQTVGSGTLTINGASISYDASQDSLNSIINRINEANAGVTVKFSNLNGGQLTLTNTDLGPAGIFLSDTGNFADALGLKAPDSIAAGQSAQLRVDGGPIQFFNQNTGLSAEGLSGVLLDLKEAEPGSPVEVNVSADTDLAIEKVQNFVTQFNAVTKYIDDLRNFNPETRQKGLFLADSTVGSIRNRLQQTLFDSVSGLQGNSALGNLSELGISTGAIGAVPGTTSELQLDTAKLRSAIESNPTRVAQLLGAEDTSTGSTGVMGRLKDYLNGLSSVTGVLNEKQRSNTRQMRSLDTRIQTMEQRLEKKQILLENQFTALERTVSRLQTQQQSLNSLFALVNQNGR